MQTSSGIDRSSLLPLYFQLKGLIVADIKARGLQPGDRMASDHELCSTYDVSRTVVRQALSELEHEGVIERQKGKGTFVAFPRVSEGLVQSLTGLYEDVAARGSHLHSQVLRCEVVPADAVIAHDLGMSEGDPVTVLERLRSIDGEPWVWTVTHLPARLVPGLENHDFADVSLYSVLAQEYRIELDHGIRTVEAAVASAAQARLLGIRVGDPVLVLRSVSQAADGSPVESFVAYHRGDRSRFQVELTRDRVGRRSRPLVIVPD
jgi:GntR family transcriptional regulator